MSNGEQRCLSVRMRPLSVSRMVCPFFVRWWPFNPTESFLHVQKIKTNTTGQRVRWLYGWYALGMRFVCNSYVPHILNLINTPCKISIKLSSLMGLSLTCPCMYASSWENSRPHPQTVLSGSCPFRERWYSLSPQVLAMYYLLAWAENHASVWIKVSSTCVRWSIQRNYYTLLQWESHGLHKYVWRTVCRFFNRSSTVLSGSCPFRVRWYSLSPPDIVLFLSGDSTFCTFFVRSISGHYSLWQQRGRYCKS